MDGDHCVDIISTGVVLNLESFAVNMDLSIPVPVSNHIHIGSRLITYMQVGLVYNRPVILWHISFLALELNPNFHSAHTVSVMNFHHAAAMD